MAAGSDYRLGSIWLVTFDPSVGTHPCPIRIFKLPLERTIACPIMPILISTPLVLTALRWEMTASACEIPTIQELQTKQLPG
jgi:hypothetical protein